MRRTRIRVPVLSTALVVAFSANLQADKITLAPVKDNTIFSNGNSNAQGELFCGRTGDFPGAGATIQRPLLTFDVAGRIPAGSTINSATLTLVLIQTSPFTGPDVHDILVVLADWGEGTSMSSAGGGAPPTTDDATWFHTFFPDQFWTTSGGDFSAIISASLSVDTSPGPYTWGPTAQMTTDVQNWLDVPAGNFGWLMTGNEAVLFTARKFGNREILDPCLGPFMTANFTPPVPTCVGDLNGNGVVDAQDLALLLGAWGCNPGHTADLNGDASVNPSDLALLLGNWGPCA